MSPRQWGLSQRSVGLIPNCEHPPINKIYKPTLGTHTSVVKSCPGVHKARPWVLVLSSNQTTALKSTYWPACRANNGEHKNPAYGSQCDPSLSLLWVSKPAVLSSGPVYKNSFQIRPWVNSATKVYFKHQ